MVAGVQKTVNLDGYGPGFYRAGPRSINISTEEVVLAANLGALVAGTVLGKVTATGQYKPHNPANSDGSELVANCVILYAPAKNSTTTQKATVDARHIVVSGRDLTYVVAMTTNQKAAVEAAMAVRNLMVRY